MKLTRSEQIVAEKTMCILLVRGRSADDQPLYAYVAVRADKLKDFIAAQNSGNFRPEDHGVVIETGVGEPSAEVKAKMTKEYGFNHETMVDIPDTDKATSMTSEILESVKPKSE